MTRFAQIGDTISCKLNDWPFGLNAGLATQEACAYGNGLIAAGRWWVSRCGKCDQPVIDGQCGCEVRE